ncbi:MAG: hypothetical protein L0I76_33320 [Pseudonocardia sp.]|nr:hypothetical protein [Pseudonocardia sp.]
MIVLADSVRVWIAALRGKPLSSGSEDAYVRSEIWAPSGLVPTREEREHARELAGSGSGTGGSGA